MFGSRKSSWRVWLVVGLALCGYSYYEWTKLHVPTEDELAQIVDTRYQEEIARLQQHAGEMPVEVTAEWQDKFKTAIRNEQMAPVEKARKRIHSTTGIGLLVLVMASGMFVATYLSEKQANEIRG
jgi:hypothetical protein